MLSITNSNVTLQPPAWHHSPGCPQRREQYSLSILLQALTCYFDHSLPFFFFFSSRRRHTRCGRDWSSDVCSSDLYGNGNVLLQGAGGFDGLTVQSSGNTIRGLRLRGFANGIVVSAGSSNTIGGKIGRASCRERG